MNRVYFKTYRRCVLVRGETFYIWLGWQKFLARILSPPGNRWIFPGPDSGGRLINRLLVFSSSFAVWNIKNASHVVSVQNAGSSGRSIAMSADETAKDESVQFSVVSSEVYWFFSLFTQMCKLLYNLLFNTSTVRFFYGKPWHI